MAELVGVLGVPHNPLLWRTMRDDMPDDLSRTAENFARFATTLEQWHADAVVVVSSDHMRRFFHDNSPAFCIGKADQFACTYENETRTFGLEQWQLAGAADLAGWLLGVSELADDFDFAMSNEWVLDHAFALPMIYLDPSHALPIVPLHTNTNIPPIPRPARFVELGHYLRRTITAMPVESRVAVVTSGHLATEIGGPRQFQGGGSPDQVFDDQAVEWMRRGDIDGALAGCTFERLASAGNVTHQFLNFLVGLGAAGGPAKFAEATPSRYANAPFFMWEGVP